MKKKVMEVMTWTKIKKTKLNKNNKFIITFLNIGE